MLKDTQLIEERAKTQAGPCLLVQCSLHAPNPPQRRVLKFWIKLKSEAYFPILLIKVSSFMSSLRKIQFQMIDSKAVKRKKILSHFFILNSRSLGEQESINSKST